MVNTAALKITRNSSVIKKTMHISHNQISGGHLALMLGTIEPRLGVSKMLHINQSVILGLSINSSTPVRLLLL